MGTAKQLLHELEQELQKLQDIKKNINRICMDVNRLEQPDVWPEGTRVRLKRSWNTDEDRRTSPGWRAFLHFMHPGNAATIKEVSVYEGKITYYVTFDNQTCYYELDGKPYKTKGMFGFKAKDLVLADAPIEKCECIEDLREWFTGKRY